MIIITIIIIIIIIMPMSVYCVLTHNTFQLSYFVSTFFSTANLDGLAKFVSNFTLIVALGA